MWPLFDSFILIMLYEWSSKQNQTEAMVSPLAVLLAQAFVCWYNKGDASPILLMEELLEAIKRGGGVVHSNVDGQGNFTASISLSAVRSGSNRVSILC